MSESKADDLVKSAEAKLSSKIPWGRDARKEEAIELLDKAATQYKISKEWKKAGDCYVKCGHISIDLKNEMEAASFYSNASKAYKNVSSKEAIKTLNLCIEIYKGNAKIREIGRTYKAIGEEEDKEGNVKEAIKAYKNAADYLSKEDMRSEANEMLLKAAELHVSQEEFDEALLLYERVAAVSLDNALTRHGVTSYYFAASFCRLSVAVRDNTNLDDVSDSVSGYKDKHPNFDNSRESKMVESSIAAINDGDGSAFGGLVAKFSNILRPERHIDFMFQYIQKHLAGTKASMNSSGIAVSGSGSKSKTEKKEIDLQGRSSSSSTGSNDNKEKNKDGTVKSRTSTNGKKDSDGGGGASGGFDFR